MKTFDVAKWSTEDIQSILIEQGIDLKNFNEDDFNKLVINFLNNNFDASIGINWSVIEHACLEVYKDLGI